MKLVIYNFKGGVGKTDIALNLALELNCGIVTNEPYSPLEMVLPENRILKLTDNQNLPDFPDDMDLIFDFGGYLDKRVSDAFRQSDKILVPVINEIKDLQITVNLIQEIEPINKNIVIIVNKTEKNDFQEAKKILHKFYRYPAFEIKKSRALPGIMQSKQSIGETVKGGGLRAYSYRTIALQFEELINHLKGVKNG